MDNLLNSTLPFHNQQNGEDNTFSIRRVGNDAHKAHTTPSDIKQTFQTGEHFLVSFKFFLFLLQVILLFKKILFILRERGREGEREGEKR